MEKIGSRFIKDELFMGHKPIPLKLVMEVKNSICKITIKKNGNMIYGTGFFMNGENSMKYLITNYHIINPEIINWDIELEIWNNKTMKINLNSRHIKYLEKPKDISIIEIKKTDIIYNNIQFLDYDRNYNNKNGYLTYKNADIFSLEHPYGEDTSCGSGKIIDINDYEFFHNIPTDNGSSGCPILLLNNNINLAKVIGIHKNADIKKN